jgi:hypothetical protein
MMSTLSRAVPPYPDELTSSEGAKACIATQRSWPNRFPAAARSCDEAAVALAQARAYYTPGATLTIAKRMPTSPGGSRFIVLRALTERRSIATPTPVWREAVAVSETAPAAVDRTTWQRWFAWHPVIIDNVTIWLEMEKIPSHPVDAWSAKASRRLEIPASSSRAGLSSWFDQPMRTVPAPLR